MQGCTSLQTDNHTSTPPLSFLQAGCPSCHPTNSVKALKAKISQTNQIQNQISIKIECIIINNNNNHDKSSPGSFDECRLNASWLLTLRQSQLTWAVESTKNWLSSTIAIVIITQPKADTHFTVARRTEG